MDNEESVRPVNLMFGLPDRIPGFVGWFLQVQEQKIFPVSYVLCLLFELSSHAKISCWNVDLWENFERCGYLVSWLFQNLPWQLVLF